MNAQHVEAQPRSKAQLGIPTRQSFGSTRATCQRLKIFLVLLLAAEQFERMDACTVKTYK